VPRRAHPEADDSSGRGEHGPIDQVFPSFAPIGALDVFLNAGKSADVNSLAVTLEGLVNRTTPRIYISDNSSAANLWLSEINAPADDDERHLHAHREVSIGDRRHRRLRRRGPRYAESRDYDRRNQGRYRLLGGALYHVDRAALIRCRSSRICGPITLRRKLAVYQYELDNYAGLASHRNIIGLTPDIPGNLRDYAVATKALDGFGSIREMARRRRCSGTI